MIKLKYDIPDGFLKEEVRNNYTITAEAKKVWAVQMDLLQELMRVCEKHKLRVFADSGTLIGAVRDKGFIPWDDDIDMVMLREDYDKLMSLSSEFKEPYFLQSIYTDEGYGNRHAQLRMSGTLAISKNSKNVRHHQGVFIDIFVLDKMPSTPRAFKRHYIKVSRARLKLKIVQKIMKRMPLSVYRWCRENTHILSDKALFRDYEKLVSNAPSTERTQIGALLCINMTVPIKSITGYNETLMLPFEHLMIPAPAGYDELLRMEYGDYMTPVKAPTLHGEMTFQIP